MSNIEYPKARRDDSVVDVYHGVSVADPYRWMEDPDSEETKNWVEAENKITQGYFASNCVLQDKIKQKLTEVYNFPKYSCSYKRGSFYYFSKNDGLQNQDVIYQMTSRNGEPKVFFDPNTLSEDGTAALGTKSFSHDGSLFAYGVSRSGSDWMTFYVMNAVTLEKYEDKVEWAKFSSISWTHDNKGFFYCRFAAPAGLENDDAEKEAKRGSEVEKAEKQEVFYHVLGTSQDKDVHVFSQHENPLWLFGTEVSDDGKYLLITPSDGCMPVNRLYYADLTTLSTYQNIQPVKLIDNFDAEYSYITNNGTRFWFKTNLNAPKYKIISFDIARPEQEHWTEVVGQSEDVLSDVMCVHNNKLVTVYMHHVKEIIKVYDLEGKFIQDVSLPDLGSVLQLCGRKEDDEFFYMFASFVYPNTIFRFDCNTMTSELIRQTEVPGHTPGDYETTQVFYPSTDGVKVPMFIISRKGIERNGKNPVYLYGYGGFSISLTPSFSTFRTVLMKSLGGVVAIPNIRGGGEYGEEWHTQAICEKRQVAFDDFISAATYLVSENYTSPDRLCIAGGSNGGCLVSTVANQRPDLFRCVISQVPVTDMFRFHKFTIGHAWCTDYGSSDVESQFHALHKYSPLHNVRGNRQYPAILVTTADHDDRVVPLHSLKYVATLQHELGASNTLPLLIRVETKAGHGAGKPTSKVIEEVAEVYAFVAAMLEMKWTD